MIPEPAIEAAARAAFAYPIRLGKRTVSRDLDGCDQEAADKVRATVRAALEAALPHLRPVVTTEAVRECRDDWANYIENWCASVGAPVCEPSSIIAALRSEVTPFGRGTP